MKVRASTASKAFGLLFRQIRSEDHRTRRLLGMVQGVATSLGNKALSVLISFLSVPLTIGYLGPERYGIWLTIGSLFAWLALTDFGLGLGFNTAIARAVGQDRPDVARRHVATALAMLSAIGLAAGAAGVLAWPWVDWNGLFGARTPSVRAELGPALATAIGIWLLQFPLSIVAKVYNAYQEGRLANYWGAAGNVLSFAALLAVTQTQGGLIWLVVALSGTGLAVNAASAAWLFLRHRPFLAPRPRDLSLASFRELSHVGGSFFLIQILGLVVFQSDNIVVAHFLGADQVPTYSVTSSLFNYCLLPQSLVFSYLWVAYTEAIARNDIDWVRRTFHTNLVAGTLFALVVAAGLVFVAQPFIAWWAGPSVVPPWPLVLWMAAWAVVSAYSAPMGCLLAAAAHLRYQMVYGTLACATNVFLTITLVQRWGLTGVIAGTVISYVLFNCVPVLVDVELLLRRLARRAGTG